MANVDWHRSSIFPADFLCTSTTIEDLSYTPSAMEKCRDDGHLADTGRRSWKTLKGKGEAVWPPLIEAALLEALERYQPESAGLKVDRSVGRFPMRNRFISEYIFELTGKTRTPKQVGSRLQQLRDTCKGDKLKKLLHVGHQDKHNHGLTRRDGFGQFVRSSLRTFDTSDHLQRQAEPIVVHVRIYLQEQSSESSPAIQLINNSSTSPQIIQPSSRCCSVTQGNLLIPFSPISVVFPSQHALALQSFFTIYTKASSSSLHIEHGHLKCLSSPVNGGGWSYGCEIVPDFWERLRTSTDISKYTIVQSITPTKSCDDLAVNVKSPVTIIYTFSLPPRPSLKPCFLLRQSTGGSPGSSISSPDHYAPSRTAAEQYHSATSLSPSTTSTPWSTPRSSVDSASLSDELHCFLHQPSRAPIWDQGQAVRVIWPSSYSATGDCSPTNTCLPESDERDCQILPIEPMYSEPARHHLPHPTSFYY